MAKNEDRFLGIDPTEVYKYMLSREDSVPAFGHHSPQLKHRLSLVEWISSSCHRFTLTATCVHLAVIILDQFMDNFIIDDEQLYLLAISCVQISAKYEEKEVDIPRPRDLVALIKHNYSNSLCMKMELIVLKHLQWNVGIPTHAHFCEYFMEELVDSTDTIHDGWLDLVKYDKAKELCQEYLNFFLDLIIKEIKYKQYKASLVSAAVMAAIRSLVDLVPTWPSRLEECTGFSLLMLGDPLQTILNDYEAAKERQAMASPSYSSSGYESRTPSPPCIDPSSLTLNSSMECTPAHDDLLTSPHRAGELNSSFVTIDIADIVDED